MPKLLNFVGQSVTPVEAYYLALDNQYVTEVRLKDCRAFMFLAKNLNPASNLWVKGLQEANTEYELVEFLKLYYKDEYKSNAADVLRLKSRSLEALSPYGTVFPWCHWSPKRRLEQWRKTVKNENQAFGLDKVELTETGHHIHGPTLTSKIELEAHRLWTVYNSIKQHGYLRSDSKDGDVIGSLLVNKSRFAISIASGQHRVCAAAAAGIETIPVRFRSYGGCPRMVRLADVKVWPHVVSGLFNKSQAKKVFRRTLSGQ